MTIQTFRSGADARRRYWARSYIGWPVVSRARPNEGHHSVAALERLGSLIGTITQNVDGLHQAAGARRVIDLHGRLDRVVCLDCGARSSREALHQRLKLANPDLAPTNGEVKPDGDARVEGSMVERFILVDCEICDGPLRPDVVFFGDNVPGTRVQDAYQMLTQASLLLVLGSSLTVFSGRRFTVRAADVEIPIAIVNQGPTRADELAQVKIDAPLGVTLTALVDRVLASTARHPATGLSSQNRKGDPLLPGEVASDIPGLGEWPLPGNPLGNGVVQAGLDRTAS
jgi:NAD-dependent SIR2 family protein deacetylase